MNVIHYLEQGANKLRFLESLLVGSFEITQWVNQNDLQKPWIVDFRMLCVETNPLGAGGYGSVYKVKLVNAIGIPGDSMAMKVWSEHINKGVHYSTLRELDALFTIDHDNLNPIKKLVLDVSSPKAVRLMPLSDLCVSDLHQLRNQFPNVESGVWQQAASDVVRAVEYLHNLNIVHRDIRPANILLGYDGLAKLTDFGLARRLTDMDLTLGVGAPEHLALELLQRSSRYGKPADCWSVGVTIYVLFTNSIPIEVLFCTLREVDVHRLLKHDNVVKSLGFTFELNADKSFACMCLLMELCVCDLKLLTYWGKFDERYRQTIALDIIKGVEYLHSYDGYMKLTDYGLSRRLDDFNLTVRVGTVGRYAPEFLTQKPHGKPADIWNLGCLIYEIYRSKRLFKVQNPREEYANIEKLCQCNENGPPRLIKKYLDQLPHLLASLLHWIFQLDPKKRPTIDKLVKNRFFRPSSSDRPRANLRELIPGAESFYRANPNYLSYTRGSEFRSASIKGPVISL